MIPCSTNRFTLGVRQIDRPAMVSQRMWSPVMSKMFDVAGLNDSLAATFRKITSRGVTMVPVVDGGRLVGIVTLQNLMHSIARVAESKRGKVNAGSAPS